MFDQAGHEPEPSDYPIRRSFPESAYCAQRTGSSNQYSHCRGNSGINCPCEHDACGRRDCAINPSNAIGVYSWHDPGRGIQPIGPGSVCSSGEFRECDRARAKS